MLSGLTPKKVLLTSVTHANRTRLEFSFRKSRKALFDKEWRDGSSRSRAHALLNRLWAGLFYRALNSGKSESGGVLTARARPASLLTARCRHLELRAVRSASAHGTPTWGVDTDLSYWDL